jgi:hypothetical protein
MSETKPPGAPQSHVSTSPHDAPRYRPVERFWPYPDLSEQPDEEELARLDPDLREALFGADDRPFSITIVFSPFDGPDFDRAVEIARGASEFRESGSGATRRYRARLQLADASRIRDLFQIVERFHDTEVLIDDRPLPYARELWLPLVWHLLLR